ncbi:protein of unknown function [Methylocella tundrae]|uniref:Uncharacterized protein n=1 Tax=Methylocella tundrae TaxID=227605 RepID=A0A4U8YYP8_METTU|nr:protein of unknown function [Methylocella tundrae]
MCAVFSEAAFAAVLSWLLVTCEDGAGSVEFFDASPALEGDCASLCTGLIAAAVDLARPFASFAFGAG